MESIVCSDDVHVRHVDGLKNTQRRVQITNFSEGHANSVNGNGQYSPQTTVAECAAESGPETCAKQQSPQSKKATR